MKTKVFLSILLAIALSASLAPTGQAKAKGPFVIGTDDAGDWGCNQDCGLAPIGDGLGQDLVSASLEMADKKTVNFIIGVNSLPPSGGVPEFSRYTWDFAVDGEAFQMSGGFTEYIRGICNPTTTNTCPPPRDPGSSPFFLRQGTCLVGTTIDCVEVALLHATFDAATATITVPVPLEVLGAKAGSKISPGVTALGGTVYSAPAAFVTNAAAPNDTLTGLKTYKIPRK